MEDKDKDVLSGNKMIYYRSNIQYENNVLD